MNAYDFITQYIDELLEISFYEGTESYDRFGEKIGGFVLGVNHNSYEKIITPVDGININTGALNGSYEAYNVPTMVQLKVIPGGIHHYKISEENVRFLAEFGFNLYEMKWPPKIIER